MLISSRITLLVRLSALGILTFCLILVVRSSDNSFSGSSTFIGQIQNPTITAEIQDGSPLTITSVALVGSDSEFVEFGYHLINVSSKPIRAYAVKQETSADGAKSGGGVSLYNPQLANSLLRPNQSIFIGGSASLVPGKRNVIILSVDFVEFSDGSKWGADSAGSSEKAEGQRAGAQSFSQRLLQILNKGKIEDVVREMQVAAMNTETPAGRSEEWRSGFREGRVAVVKRLRRSKEKSGLSELERELRRMGETFKSKD